MAFFGLILTRAELREIHQADAVYRCAAAKYRLCHAAYMAAGADDPNRERLRIELLVAYRQVSYGYAELATLRKLPTQTQAHGATLPSMPGMDDLPDMP